MFSELLSLLGWKPLLPHQELILLSHPASGVDSRFLAHHFLSLAAQTDAPVALLAFHYPFFHYSCIQKKLGHPLEKLGESFHFIDACTQASAPQVTPFNPEEHLNPLEELEQRLRALSYPEGGLVLIDSLLGLQCLASSSEVLQWLLNLQQWAVAKNLCVVLLTAAEDQTLVPILRHMATWQLDVCALASGYNRAVSGLLTVRGPAEGGELRPQATLLQFKVLEHTVKFMAHGTT
eukprot:NODE_4243_length_819_cov_59.239884_g4085_i0.p1 GENE.NODE_4243_length_819_cov_59.239884_g4085_i0~~NODE_4243_length_819_cov_59.239884_g4085_i0.p1  ORF type:complete len:252 (+),score=52.32 NODE_4243_length_819_cov_59.239884_g4085_i0:53-757(+)